MSVVSFYGPLFGTIASTFAYPLWTLYKDIAIPGNGQYVSHIEAQRVPGLKNTASSIYRSWSRRRREDQGQRPMPQIAERTKALSETKASLPWLTVSIATAFRLFS